jgi:N-acetylmuramoyl-L-alanine amidase
MPVTVKDYPLNEGQYVKTPSTKTHVVWHGTMGRTRHTPFNGSPGKATSSIDGWNSDDLGRVGATYLVDRNGDIYRCFDEKYWIFHLGLSGTNGKYDKTSIGIELANELSLLSDGGKFYAFDKISRNTEYTGRTFTKPWRDKEHWAALDEPQVDAAIALTLEICHRNRITPKFYRPSTAFNYPACFEKATIICHSNCRRDKGDLLLEDWIWDKVRAARIEIVEN